MYDLYSVRVSTAIILLTCSGAILDYNSKQVVSAY